MNRRTFLGASLGSVVILPCPHHVRRLTAADYAWLAPLGPLTAAQLAKIVFPPKLQPKGKS